MLMIMIFIARKQEEKISSKGYSVGENNGAYI